MTPKRCHGVQVINQALYPLTGDLEVFLEHGKPSFESCGYGDETYQQGDVVLTLEHVCLQLVCHNGKVVRRHLDQPSDKHCELWGFVLIIFRAWQWRVRVGMAENGLKLAKWYAPVD